MEDEGMAIREALIEDRPFTLLHPDEVWRAQFHHALSEFIDLVKAEFVADMKKVWRFFSG